MHCTFTYTYCVQVLKYYLIWECPDVFCAGGVGLERCDLCGWLCGVWGSLANCCVVLMRSVLYGAAHEVRSLLAGRQVCPRTDHPFSRFNRQMPPHTQERGAKHIPDYQNTV